MLDAELLWDGTNWTEVSDMNTARYATSWNRNSDSMPSSRRWTNRNWGSEVNLQLKKLGMDQVGLKPGDMNTGRERPRRFWNNKI